MLSVYVLEADTAFDGATPRLFRPMYAGANMGHPGENYCPEKLVIRRDLW